MPGQKNSANKRQKKGESMLSKKHNAFIQDLMEELRLQGNVEDIYLGRVIRKLGNGRVEVLYVVMEDEETFDKDGNEITKKTPVSYVKQAIIQGRFRGKGKHTVWVEFGSIVAIADNGIGVLEVIAVLTQEQLNTIAKTSYVDNRIMKPPTTDGDPNGDDDKDGGIIIADDSDSEKELDISNI